MTYAGAKEQIAQALLLLEEDPELFVKEAAEKVGVKPMTLYQHMHRNGIKRERPKRRVAPLMYKTKQGRPHTPEMAEKKRRAISLIEINPTLSIAQVARHFDVSESTVSKWFGEANFRKWF